MPTALKRFELQQADIAARIGIDFTTAAFDLE